MYLKLYVQVFSEKFEQSLLAVVPINLSFERGHLFPSNTKKYKTICQTVPLYGAKYKNHFSKFTDKNSQDEKNISKLGEKYLAKRKASVT